MVWLFLLFFVTPLVELYLLIQIGRVIGAGPTILLVVVTAIAGAALTKREGLGVLRRIQEQLSMGVLPTDPLIEGVIVLACGLMLITPGIVTDSAALLLLILPPLRLAVVRALKRWFLRKFEVRITHTGAGFDSRNRYYYYDDPEIIDLPEDSYKVKTDDDHND